MVYCVALSGNLGSGKSTIAQLFSNLGVPIIYADQISREVTEPGEEAYQAILTHFGPGILLADKRLDRTKLRQIVFSDPEALSWLEALLHPLIRSRIQKQVEDCQAPYCILEIPLAIDKTLYPYVNRILLVTAPLEEQIRRVQSRDNCSKEQAVSILAKQPSEKERLDSLDDLIENNGGLEELQSKVQALHTRYLEFGKKFVASE